MRIGAICWIVACFAAFAAGCGDKSTGGNNADASVLDGALADSSQPDGALPDAEVPDAEVPDAEVPDAEVLDAEVPDAVVPDAEVSDAVVPDAEVSDAEVPDAGPQCGDGVVNTGELCDTGIPSGPGTCPTSCTTTDPCQPITLQSGGTCAAECVTTTITQCTAGDGCCPTGCNATSDADCAAVCGNGVLESGEQCDTAISSGAGSCPTACDDSDPCTIDTLQSAGTCAAECATTNVTTCVGGDSCCPSGCDAVSDTDCGSICGNAVLEPGELCDTAIGSGVGSCPTACDDSDPCTVDTLQSPGTCLAECTTSPLTACLDADSCCPSGCNAANDDDCAAVCGNGVLETGELCDTGISSGAGSCPTNCDDGDGCTVDTVVGTGCQAECDHTTIAPLPSGTGFDMTEIQWNLPDISAWGNNFYWVQKENESGYWNWATIDMNGDSIPDLVWTEDPNQYYDAWMNGTQPYWKVFLGTGAGFAPTEIQWNLPDMSAWGNNFYWVQKENESGYWNWATMDMNGDGMPDLVWTEDPDQYYDAWMNGVQPYWKVFLNTGTGFAPTEIQWNLPDISAWGNNFYWVQKENESGYWNWATMDMNGDGMPDLVWTEDPNQYYDAWMNGAQPYWKVFLNTGTGFALTEIQWNLPDMSAWGNNFYWVQKENESGYWNWATIDMNGDGRPDLVWTEDPDQYYDAWMNGTQPFWKVFLNTGTGFAPTELQWNLPDISAWGNNFYWVQKENESGYWNWRVLDMDGDARPDLVWTEDPDQYYDAWNQACEPYWKVFLNSGTGFAAVETVWRLPDISAWGNNFYWVHKENESGYWNWTVRDMDGDGQPDLVWTEDPDQYYDAWMNGAQPFWKVFLAQ